MRKRAICSVLLVLFLGTMLLYAGKQEWQKNVPGEKTLRHYTAFFNVEGQELNENNEIKKVIAQLIGAECEEIWLTAQTQEEAVNLYIANGEYPDFISGTLELYEAGALIPLDHYLKDYPNLQKYVETIGEERLRLEDGHIYWLPQFGVVN